MSETTTEHHMVPSDTDGIELHLVNKRPESMSTFAPETTVVLVHGATFSAGSLFDVPFAGESFLDRLAAAGYDVFALDVRSYGHSTRPPELEQPPEESDPVAGTDTGVADLGAAVSWVRSHRGIDRVNVFGMSWGGTVAGAFTAANRDVVRHLGLLAPQWLSADPNPLAAGGGDPLGGYRLVPVRDAEDPWRANAPQGAGDSLIPEGWFEQWAEWTLAEDPWSSSRTPGLARATNGPIRDAREYWAAGRAYYDPARIEVPVLLIHGEWDADVPIRAAMDFFLQLRGAPYRRWTEIGEATHLVLLEKNRHLAIDALIGFLGEDHSPEA